MLNAPAIQVGDALAPVRRALGLRKVLRWTLWGLAAGAVLGTVLLAATRIVGSEPKGVLALALCAVGAIIGAGWAVARWPTRMDAARAVDLHFSLKDRVTTALEFDGSSEPLVLLQRREAARLVGELPLRESARTSFQGRELAALAGSALLLAGALALPYSAPSHHSATRTASPRLNAVRQAALAHLHAISRELAAGLTPQQRRSPAAKQALSTISHLEAQLKRAGTQEEALRDISQAQTRLQHLNARLHPVSGTTGTRFTKVMKGNLTRNEHADELNGRQHLDKAAAKFLHSLAGSASTMTQNQRSRVARALQKAANDVPDAPLHSDLQEAASALGHNDVKTARRALNHAASRFEKSANQKTTKVKINKAHTGLDSVKNDVNGTHRPGQSQQDNGQTPPPNAQRSALQGGSERGQASPSGGVGGGNGVHGRGARLRGRQGEDKASDGGGTNRAGTGSGDKYAVVYVPGVVKRGGRPLPYELHGTPKRVPAVPYKQVIAQYNRTARASLGRSPLPPSEQEYVRRYFTALSR